MKKRKLCPMFMVEVEMTETKTYDDGVSDCWDYLYYELGMKDLADEMFEFVHNQQKDEK